MDPREIWGKFDPHTGELAGARIQVRRLGDLRGCFADPDAYAAALAGGDRAIYTIATLEPGSARGDLHVGVGRIEPGRVGAEYHMTRGHLHAWREAAEVYVGLSGVGMMLLDGEDGTSRALPLAPHHVVYVPGRTAHRTVNVGPEPLTYLAVYPAAAGHDYAAIAATNFRSVVVAEGGRVVVRGRQEHGS